MAELKTVTGPGVDHLVSHWVNMHIASSQRGECTRHYSSELAEHLTSKVDAGQARRLSVNHATVWGAKQGSLKRAAAELFRRFQSVIVPAKTCSALQHSEKKGQQHNPVSAPLAQRVGTLDIL